MILALTIAGVAIALVALLWSPAGNSIRHSVAAFRQYVCCRIHDRVEFGRGSPWCTHVKSQGGNATALRILRKFMDAYNREEKATISSGYVITDFEAYGAFIRGAIEAVYDIGRKQTPRGYVYLITCLALPCAQWFNYGRTQPQHRQELPPEIRNHPLSGFQYIEPKWKEYTDFVSHLIESQRNGAGRHTKMFRYLLAFHRDVVKSAEGGQTNQPIELLRERSEENTRIQLQSCILCDSKRKPIPVRRRELSTTVPPKSWIGESGNPWFQFYQQKGDESDPKELESKDQAYIIVPEESLRKSDRGRLLNPKSGYQWRKVKEVFAEWYQDSDRNLLVSVLDQSVVDNRFERQKDPIPQDFFLIGISNDDIAQKDLFKGFDTISWLSCLSIYNPDERLDKLELHFIMPRGHESPRVAPLEKIVEFLRDEVNIVQGSNTERESLGYVVAHDVKESSVDEIE